jgi:hypothetical protein
LSDTTVLIPFLRGGREDWLREAINSFPQGTPYLVCENDGELATAINEGLARVETEFVLPFGADDVARNGLIENLESLAWNVDVVYPSMVLVDEELKPLGWHAADPFCGNRLLTWNYVTGASLIRTSKLREVGGCMSGCSGLGLGSSRHRSFRFCTGRLLTLVTVRSVSSRPGRR